MKQPGEGVPRWCVEARRRVSRLRGCRFALVGRLRRVPRKWRIAAVCALALAAVGLWLLLRAVERPDPTWERIQATRVLRVCTDPSWLPFEAVNPITGQIEGLDADLASLLAGRSVPEGRAELVTVGFDSLYDALIAGRCDAVLSALPYEASRTRDVAYSVAYFNAGVVLVVREGTPVGVELEDLGGRAVGVEWGFVFEGDSRQRQWLQALDLRRFDTADDALTALQTGQVDAALVDRISALSYMARCPGVRIAGKPLADVNYVIPVRPDSYRLLRAVNRELIQMRLDGTLDALLAKWF